MIYKLSYANPQHHLLDIEITFSKLPNNHEIRMQLPAWRPGRYELGNFAKNIQKFNVTNEKGEPLEHHKESKDLWVIKVNGAKSIVIQYTYYAAELNAGSTYLDTEQLYVNPINCLMYCPDKFFDPIVLHVDLPDHYTLACSLPQKNKFELTAHHFDELADSPFIASGNLKHYQFQTGALPTHVWIQGECKPDEEKIKEDFTKFMEWQLDLFPSCPSAEYHYLIQILPVHFYHGVEHKNSTVLALGPGYALNESRYGDLLGVACHEFYHVWNIKTIRPAEMWPYDFTKENYFTTGFVAEGVTTYMGDYILWQSAVFSDTEFFHEMSGQLQKHFDNFGRFNHSVAQSGYDTWLDGYVPGIPDRKVSIYTEGCLLAFMTDILLMKYTHREKSLHDVMRILYEEFYLKRKGYTYEDYVKVVSRVADQPMHEFFEKYARGTENYRPQLEECFDWLGLHLVEQLSGFLSESHFGFKLAESLEKSVVTAIHPKSPASHYALALNDQVIAVNGFAVKGDANKWINYFGLFPLELDIIRNSQLMKVNLKPDGKEYYKQYRIKKSENPNRNQEKMFEVWKNKK